MPTYEYVCKECDHAFEAFQSMKDDPLTDCPVCETGKVRRKIGLGAGIIFKGSGFYETDFKDRKGTKPTEGGDSPSESKSGSDAATGAGEAAKSAPAAASSSTSASSSDK